MEETLRVLHVTDADIAGGAARCAHRLHRGLREIGVDSRMLVRRAETGDEHVHRFAPEDGLSARLRRRVRAWRIRRDRRRYRETEPAWAEPFWDDRSPYAVEGSPWLRECDVVHLHWISGFVDYRRFFRALPTELPVVWTLHDMNPFTGGCHYDVGCGRHREACGACPQLGSSEEEDLSRAIWERKREAFAGIEPGRLHIVAPSRWLAAEARSSSLFGSRFEVSVIPYGIDLDQFAPQDRVQARRALELPADAKVLLFVAESVENRRKGFDLLQAALSRLEVGSGLHLLSIGKGDVDLGGPVPHRALGFTTENRLLALGYSAADLFIAPSRQDNLPATVLEALACGLPVVGLEAGGIPDMVRPGETGWLARPGDAGDLASVLRAALADEPALRRRGREARALAEREYALEVQARRYQGLYRRLLGREQVGATAESAPAAERVAVASPAARTGSER